MSLSAVLQILVGGLANGSAYALIAVGFVVIYRVTGIINFAQGDFAMLGAMIAAGLVAARAPLWLAAGTAILITSMVAGVFYLTAIRPARSSGLAGLIVITVGLSVLLRGLAQRVWGVEALPVPAFSSDEPLLIGGVSILPQQLWLVATMLAVVLLVFVLFEKTVVGMALRASASNPFAASLVGINRGHLGLLAFVLAGFVGAVGGVVLAPLSYAQVDIGLALGLKGFTAALLGGIVNPYGAVAGGLVFGLIEAGASGFISSGYRDAISFGVLLLILLVRPGGILGTVPSPTVEDGEAGELTRSAPIPGTRFVRRNLPILVLGLAIVVVPQIVPTSRLNALIFIGINGIVVLGMVLLSGYAGQISLGQTAFYGLGAYASAILTTKLGWPSLPAMLAGAAVSALVALALGGLIFRLRGFYLSMASLGLAVIVSTFFVQWVALTGGPSGLPGIPPFNLFGLSVTSELGYVYLVWAVLLLVLVFCLNVVHSRVGRAFLAVRASESAASSCGADVRRLKMLALVLSAIFASLGGSLYVHYVSVADPSAFGFETMVALLTVLTVGGFTSLWGTLIGAAIVVLLPSLLALTSGTTSSGEMAAYQRMAYGVLLMAAIILFQHGLGPSLSRLLGWLLMARGRPDRVQAETAQLRSSDVPLFVLGSRVPGDEMGPERNWHLEVRDLTVRFGGLLAVDGLSFAVRSGAVVALIGPNGAGKTTTFNVIAGALAPTHGTVLSRGVSITGQAPRVIAAAGIARTYQNVRLFLNLSVIENVMMGHFLRGTSGVLAAGLRMPSHWRDETAARQMALRCLNFVGLEAYADRSAATLPLGLQRLAEVARALAQEPHTLLLDEPAAGLNAAEKQVLGDLIGRLRASGVTILLVEHDVALVMRLADHVVVMYHGCKLADGAPSLVRSDPAVIASYLGA